MGKVLRADRIADRSDADRMNDDARAGNFLIAATLERYEFVRDHALTVQSPGI